MRQVIEKLKNGNIGVLGTDTLYGLVGSAMKSESVERMYRVRKRDLSKPMIVLISSMKDLALFEITPNEKEKKYLENVWPGPVSVILPCKSKKFKYLHRGANSIAFRVPDKLELVTLLQEVGPLVAPSANLEGEEPAKNIKEAKEYFSHEVDFYNDEGELSGKPSKLASLLDGEPKMLRD